MTRFTDRVERDLGQIADRATPSSTAWEAIRTRIEEQPDHEPTMEVIMLTPNDDDRRNRSKTWLLAAAAAVVVIGIGSLTIAFTGGDDEGAPVVDQPEDVSQTEVDTPEAEQALPPVPEPLPDTETSFGPGAYSTDLLGMRTTFETSANHIVGIARPGGALIIREDAGSFSAFSLGRIGGWFTGEQARDVAYVEEGTIDPYDIDGWIAANDVIAETLPDTTVDGRPTVVRQITIDPSSTAGPDCPIGRAPCLYTSSLSTPSFDPAVARDGNMPLTFGITMRTWLVEVEGFDPIEIVAYVDGPNLAWLDEFEETILPTITFGPDAPAMPR